jgi:hypothetical protein
MLSCLAPQATLLYWGANGAFYYGLNWLQQSQYAKYLGLPSAMLPLPTSRKEEKGEATFPGQCSEAAAHIEAAA